MLVQMCRLGVAFARQTGRAVLSAVDESKVVEALFAKLTKPMVLPPVEFEMGEISTDKSDAEFGAMIEAAKEHLRAGNIYQIVISRTFKAKVAGDPFQFDRALRKTGVRYLDRGGVDQCNGEWVLHERRIHRRIS